MTKNTTERDAYQNERFRSLRGAMAGCPEDIERVVADSGDTFDSFEEDSPGSFTAENTWTDLSTYNSEVLAPGRYSVDLVCSWSIASANSRVSGVRITVNGQASSGFTRETDSTEDIAHVTSFTDFSIDDPASMVLKLQGFLETGGGAVLFDLLSFRLRLKRVSEPSVNAEIVVA